MSTCLRKSGLPSFWILTVLTAFAGIARPAVAQFEVGNGGDVIFCRAESGQRFGGYYFLDYIATWDEVAGPDAFHDDAQPLALIIRLLTERFPALGNNLQEFADQAERQLATGPDMTQRFIWMRTSNGLVTLKDEQLSFLPESFPQNCLMPQAEPGDRRALQLHQVIIHDNRGQARVYKYDHRYADLIVSDALQYSFMIVHEWLWQYTNSATVVRDVNRFLHTKALQGTDYRTLKLSLENLGLDLSQVGPSVHEIILNDVDPSRIPVRDFLVDPELGVEIRLVNGVDGFFRVKIEAPGIHFAAGYLRPRSLNGPLQVQQVFRSAGEIQVSGCNAVTQDCGPSRTLVRLRLP